LDRWDELVQSASDNPIRTISMGEPKRCTGILNAKKVWICNGCGAHHSNREYCHNQDHPNWNPEDCPWSESTIGKQWMTLGKNQLPQGFDINGNPIKLIAVERHKQAVQDAVASKSSSTAGATSSSRVAPPTAHSDRSESRNRGKWTQKKKNAQRNHPVGPKPKGKDHDILAGNKSPNSISLVCAIEHRSIEIPAVIALVDSGAELNYITSALADKLEELGVVTWKSDETVCTTPAIHDVTGQPFHSIASATYQFLNVIFKDVISSPILNNVSFHKKIRNVPFFIVPSLHDGLELIIGMECIRQHDLTRVLHKHFVSSRVVTPEEQQIAKCYELLDQLCIGGDELSPQQRQAIKREFGMVAAVLASSGRHIADAQDDPITSEQSGDGVSSSPTSPPVSATTTTMVSPSVIEEDPLFRTAIAAPMVTSSYSNRQDLNTLLQFDASDILPDPFDGVFDLGEMLPKEEGDPKVQAPEPDPLPQVLGDTQFHKDIRLLCLKYKDIFSREVKPTAAFVEPLQLELKENSTFLQRPGGPPRKQSIEKQREILRQLKQMLRLGVIRRSGATSYSQVTLAPKPNSDKLRFCVDYRVLNQNLKMAQWVIPNIRSLLERIGEKKPKIFGVVDLTSGYHQTPLAADSCKLAAFVTDFGIFEPVRVPFGIHVAPAYFQRTMAGTLLRELMYKNMEMYIDDVIIYAQSEEEFLLHLEQLFQKCRQHNLTLHPDKCRLGLPQIEYVGHVIDHEGLFMSEAKIRKVLDFPKPSTVKELQSFLGLANYFRDHIDKHSIVTAPLYAMIPSGASGRTAAQWSSDCEEAYNTVKRLIEHCPKLYFPTDIDPQKYEIVVETDACNHGIGACLYIREIGLPNTVVEVDLPKEGEPGIPTGRRPIAFISKSLSPTERRWSTIEQEQYAIFYALKQWEHLLRGRHFILRTDHKNLLVMNNSSPKVLRWKLALQEFSCDVEHVEGKHNVAADALSRLMESETSHDEADESTSPSNVVHTTLGAIGYQIPQIPDDKYKIILQCHNTTVGHCGVDKTLQKVKDYLEKTTGQPRKNCTWQHMRKHIMKFVRECPICQKNRHAAVLHNVAPYHVSSLQPMQRWSVDSIGPIEIDNPEGYRHILVITDNFTRFTCLYPTVSTGAEEAAKVLLQHIGHYGKPAEIQSDRGPQFVNDTIQYLVKRMGIHWMANVAYSKQENGIVERANKEVLRHLKSFIYEHNVLDKWVACLPLVQRILNSTIHESIGMTPAQLLFGNNVDLDRGIFLDNSESLSEDAPTTDVQNRALRDHIEALWKAQDTLVAKAQEIQEEVLAKLDKSKQPSGPISQYEPGSYVLLTYPDRPPSKLHMPWRGPRKVLSSDGPHLVVLNLLTGATETVHINMVKPFAYDATKVDPKVVATHDDQTDFVEKILWHRGDFKQKRNLFFKVKFLGRDVEEGADKGYLPWKDVRNTDALDAYLRHANLERYVPKNRQEWNKGPLPTLGIPTGAPLAEGEEALYEAREEQMIAEAEAAQDEAIVPAAHVTRPARKRQRTLRYRQDASTTKQGKNPKKTKKNYKWKNRK